MALFATVLVLGAALSAGLRASHDTSDVFYSQMNSLCEAATSDLAHAHQELTVMELVFCMSHLMLHKRGYSNEWDNGAATTMGYYRGARDPPYQMSQEQYMHIATIIMSIPHAPVQRKEATSPDEPSNYRADPATGANFIGNTANIHRGNEGPRVLFWGCGADTPMWQEILDYLGGSITFLENNADWLQHCKDSGGKEVLMVNFTGTKDDHASYLGRLATDGSSNSPDALDAELVALRNEVIPLPISVSTGKPFDVIVVDGPAEAIGRSQPLYMSSLLAQSYGVDHFTHILLHDAARPLNIEFANKILGHDPKNYIGNSLPRKGLKHWRLQGIDRPLQ